MAMASDECLSWQWGAKINKFHTKKSIKSMKHQYYNTAVASDECLPWRRGAKINEYHSNKSMNTTHKKINQKHKTINITKRQ